MAGYASVRDGKWHKTLSDEPTFMHDETSACGVTFRPMNVTYPEAPTCVRADVSLCRHCFAADEIAGHLAAWRERNGISA